MRARPNHRAVGTWISKVRRLAIYMRDDFCCMYCGEDLADEPERWSLDHLDGHRAGHHETNLVMACTTCNSKRGNMPLRKWMRTDLGTRWLHMDSPRKCARRSLRPHLKRAKAFMQHFGFGPP